MLAAAAAAVAAPAGGGRQAPLDQVGGQQRQDRDRHQRQRAKAAGQQQRCREREPAPVSGRRRGRRGPALAAGENQHHTGQHGTRGGQRGEPVLPRRPARGEPSGRGADGQAGGRAYPPQGQRGPGARGAHLPDQDARPPDHDQQVAGPLHRPQADQGGPAGRGQDHRAARDGHHRQPGGQPRARVPVPQPLAGRGGHGGADKGDQRDRGAQRERRQPERLPHLGGNRPDLAEAAAARTPAAIVTARANPFPARHGASSPGRTPCCTAPWFSHRHSWRPFGTLR